MPKFSQRYGYSPLEYAFQRESIDEALRTKLWNVLKIAVWDQYNPHDRRYAAVSEKIDGMVRRLWFHFLNHDLDSLPDFLPQYPGDKNTAYLYLKNFFFSCNWFELYDFTEEISLDQSELIKDETREWINNVLEEQNAAYRFVGKEIVEITDKQEIEAIEEGLEYPEKAVRTHLEAALRMLSDKQSPDYRNSVKESISAVEAACRLASGKESATLGDALKKIQNIHPALSKAFNLLYGYTSDASGIRHSLVDEPNITYADAKFMLIACSAFVSYLKTASK
ncbi:MAG: hypothetical protein OEV23_01390 [Gallionella sp.]|nr:hypothetical protein [Gallionella sp.]